MSISRPRFKTPPSQADLVSRLVSWGGDAAFLRFLEGLQSAPLQNVGKRSKLASQMLNKVEKLSAELKAKAPKRGWARALERLRWMLIVEVDSDRIRLGPPRKGQDPTSLTVHYWRGALVPYTAFLTSEPQWVWIDDWLKAKGIAAARTQVWWQNTASAWNEDILPRPGPRALIRAACAFLLFDACAKQLARVDMRKIASVEIEPPRRSWSKTARKYQTVLRSLLPITGKALLKVSGAHELPVEYRVLWPVIEPQPYRPGDFAARKAKA